jgi:signal transduction histidine kinase
MNLDQTLESVLIIFFVAIMVQTVVMAACLCLNQRSNKN